MFAQTVYIDRNSTIMKQLKQKNNAKKIYGGTIFLNLHWDENQIKEEQDDLIWFDYQSSIAKMDGSARFDRQWVPERDISRLVSWLIKFFFLSKLG